MASYLGKIGEYDSATEEWPSYRERLEHYLKANKVADEQKNTFLTCNRKGYFWADTSAHRTREVGGQDVQ